MASTRSPGATWVEHDPLDQSCIKSCGITILKNCLCGVGDSAAFSLLVSDEWCLVLMANILLSLSAICL